VYDNERGFFLYDPLEDAGFDVLMAVTIMILVSFGCNTRVRRESDVSEEHVYILLIRQLSKQ
jgi:hypothetical protein